MKLSEMKVTRGKNGVEPMPVFSDDRRGEYARVDAEVTLMLVALPLELAIEAREKCGGRPADASGKP